MEEPVVPAPRVTDPHMARLIEYAAGIWDEVSVEETGTAVLTDEGRASFWELRATMSPRGEELFQAALLLALSQATVNYDDARALAKIIVWRASPDYEALDDIVSRRDTPMTTKGPVA